MPPPGGSARAKSRGSVGRAPVCWLTTGGARRGSALGETHVPHTAYLHTQAYRPRTPHGNLSDARGPALLSPKEAGKVEKKKFLRKICDFGVSCMFYGTFIIENVSESAAATR